MAPKERRKPDPTHTEDEKPDSAGKDSPTSDPVSFIEPVPERSNDTPLDKERETRR